MRCIPPTEAIRKHVEEVTRLRCSREDVDGQIETHVSALRALIPPGSACEFEDARVEVRRPEWGCVVHRLNEVPLGYIRPAPDEARILEAFLRTGEILPGVSYSLAASVVVIRGQAPTPTERGPP